MNLTDPDFIKRLETLSLLTRKAMQGKLRAERKSRSKGRGIIFTDYSEYKFGDDYRGIDWHVYARMEQLIVKLFEVEEDTDVCVLLDSSCSMKSKFPLALELTAALGYIALHGLDRLGIWQVTDRPRALFDLSNGRNKSLSMLRILESAETSKGTTDLAFCMKQFQLSRKRPALCIVISDFFSPGYEEGLKLLRWAKHDVFCLQILDEKELATSLKGDVEFECVETDQRMRVTVTPAQAQAFAEKMQEWNERLVAECGRLQAGFARARSSDRFDDIMRGILRKGGLVG